MIASCLEAAKPGDRIRWVIQSVLWLAGVVSFSCQCLGADPVTVSRLFPVGGQAGTETSIAFKGKFPNPDLRVWPENDGIQWNSEEEPGKFLAKIGPDATPGIHFIRLVDSVSASPWMPFVVGNIPEIVEIEPNQTIREITNTVDLPVTINGILENRGDVDGFCLKIAAGDSLVASLQANEGLGSPVDMVMQLTDQNGNVLETNHDYHGLDPLISWTSDRDQVVFVRLYGFPSAPDSSIALSGGETYLYRLTLTTGPFLEATLPLALQQGVETQVSAVGWGISPQSTTVSVTPAPSVSTQIIQFEGVAGFVELPVLSFPSLAETTQADSVAGNVPIPVCLAGTISVPDEVDRFRFEAQKDETLIFKLESRALGCPLDAVLQIETTEEKVLQRVDDVGKIVDPLIRWKVPETGAYQVSIVDVNSWASPHAYYRLMIQPESADFHLRTSADLLAAKVNEPFEISITVDRQAGFDKGLTLSLESLPEGVTCEPVVSEPMGESAKLVKLKVVCSQPVNAPISIVGTTLGDTAFAKSVKTDQGHDSLWLYAQ